MSLVTISRAPLAEIEAFKKRMSWRFRWVSSYGTDFNYDYHVSFSKEEAATGKVYYNYDNSGLRERRSRWPQCVLQGRKR